MPGNSRRRGAIRKSKPKPVVGSGGQRRGGLKGKGPTLPAADRPWHKAYAGPGPVPEGTRRKQEREQRQKAARRRPPARG
jgi:23S rRNA (guanosine2251-2'-O)-methyltransferase